MIVNLTTGMGGDLTMGDPDHPEAFAKWALIGLTKTPAMELGPFGIRANVICPGSVDGHTENFSTLDQ